MDNLFCEEIDVDRPQYEWKYLKAGGYWKDNNSDSDWSKLRKLRAELEAELRATERYNPGPCVYTGCAEQEHQGLVTVALAYSKAYPRGWRFTYNVECPHCHSHANGDGYVYETVEGALKDWKARRKKLAANNAAKKQRVTIG